MNRQLCGNPDGPLFHRRFERDAHSARRRDTLDIDLKKAAEKFKELGPLR